MKYETEVFDIDELIAEARQAGRLQAFEEAANICWLLSDSPLNNEAYSQACLDCMDEIMLSASKAKGETE